MSRSNVSSCRFLPLRVGKPLFTDASIVSHLRGVRFFGARFCSPPPPPSYMKTGTIQKHWNRATIYAKTKRVHEQLSEIRTLECGLKNCGKGNVMCNIIWKLCKQQTHINGSTHSYCRTKALKMYQTKRLESDVTQESLTAAVHIR